MKSLMIALHENPFLCRMPASEGLCRWVWPQSAAHQLQPTMSRCINATTSTLNGATPSCCMLAVSLSGCKCARPGPVCKGVHLRACRMQRCLRLSLTPTWSPPDRRRCCRSRRRPPAQVSDALMPCASPRACAPIRCWRLCRCMRQRLLCLWKRTGISTVGRKRPANGVRQARCRMAPRCRAPPASRWAWRRCGPSALWRRPTAALQQQLQRQTVSSQPHP
jgi:hypothetical protein